MPIDQEKNLKKLEDLLKIVDEGVTKEEFVKAFENVVNLVLKIEKRNSDAVDALERTYANLLDKIRNDHTSSLSDVGDQLKRIKTEHDNKMMAMDMKMAEVKDGKPGKDANEEKVIQSVMARIILLVLEKIDNRLPSLGNSIRDGLEKLKNDERLDISAIKGLEDYEDIKKSSKEKTIVYSGGGGAKGRVHYYDLTSQCNGVLKTFTIPSNFGVLGVWGTQYPVNLRPMIDWTIGNKTLTLTSEVSAPQTGQTLWCMYIK
jgi:hypothetical protein